MLFGLGPQLFHHPRLGLAILDGCDELGQGAPMGFAVALDGAQGGGCMGVQVLIAAHDHLANHALQAHALAVLRAVDARHAIGLQFADLFGDDDATASSKHLYVCPAALAQQIDHVFEVFDMAALVRADGNALHIFLQSGSHHLVDRAVVAQMDDLGAHALEDAAHDIDGRVVAVKQAGSGDKAHLVFGAVIGQGLEFSGQVGHGVSPHSVRAEKCPVRN